MSKLIVNEIEKYDAGQLTITTGTDVSIGSDLTISGNLSVTGTVLDSNGDAGTSGQILSSTGTGTNWIDAAAGGGGVSGSGTTNYIPKWSSSSAIGNSLMQESGNFVSIGESLDSGLSVDLRGLKVGGLNYLFGTVGTSGKHNFYTGLNYNAAPTADGSSANAIVSTAGGDFRPCQYVQFQGNHIFRNALSATAGSAISWSERMRIDSSGNVGIGTSSPSSNLDVVSTADNNSYATLVHKNVSGGGNSGLRVHTNGSDAGAGAYALMMTSGNTVASPTNTIIKALVNGNVLIGTTTDFGGRVNIAGDNTSIVTRGATSTNSGTWVMQRQDTGADTWRISSNQDNFFIADADFSHYAFLTQNPTSWAFGSDERLKQDIEDVDYGLDTILNLKPRRFTFKSSQKNTIGFVAQELIGVVPEAVTGQEKEILDTDTNEEIAKKILGVSSDTLIPILVKAIQELKAEIESLKSQING